MEYLRNRDELGIRRTGGVELGDARRTKRLIRLMEGLWAHPSGRIPVASGGFAQTKAAYRLLENPALEWREILEVHTQRTVERIAGQAVALCIQDTTALDFTSQPGIAGLGRLSYGVCQIFCVNAVLVSGVRVASGPRIEWRSD